MSGISCGWAATNPGPPSTPLCRFIPLTDLCGASYLNQFQGGLYAGGSNQMPADHAAVGQSLGLAVTPRDVNGNPSATGKYVLLSIGMSNTAMEFCAAPDKNTGCTAGSFKELATNDTAVNNGPLVLVNGAKSSTTADKWLDGTQLNRIRDTHLANNGLTEKQVQVLWIKVVNSAGTAKSLPAPNADAYGLMSDWGKILRLVRSRYPNLKQVFFSSRTYAGYARCGLNPEPIAYESGLAVKWMVDAQIRQMRTGVIDLNAGDLSYSSGVAPWIAWGPYLWTDGANPRSDGLTWQPDDTCTPDYPMGDYTHPSPKGVAKVGAMLLGFFKSSAVTKCWFLKSGTCP